MNFEEKIQWIESHFECYYCKHFKKQDIQFIYDDKEFDKDSGIILYFNVVSDKVFLKWSKIFIRMKNVLEEYNKKFKTDTKIDFYPRDNFFDKRLS